jgi:ribosome-interacting GTPase 1
VVLQTEHCTLEDFCNKIHRTILKELKYALVWGSSVKHQPQIVRGIRVVIHQLLSIILKLRILVLLPVSNLTYVVKLRIVL